MDMLSRGSFICTKWCVFNLCALTAEYDAVSSVNLDWHWNYNNHCSRTHTMANPVIIATKVFLRWFFDFKFDKIADGGRKVDSSKRKISGWWVKLRSLPAVIWVLAKKQLSIWREEVPKCIWLVVIRNALKMHAKKLFALHRIVMSFSYHAI